MNQENEMEENNRLIAEFYGAKYQTDDYGDFGYLFEKPFVENWHTMFRPDSMKFHTSWDWLMPVVEKCISESDRLYNEEVTEDWWIFNFDFHTKKSSWVEFETGLYLNDPIKAETAIEAVYNAVIQFITWYNNAK